MQHIFVAMAEIFNRLSRSLWTKRDRPPLFKADRQRLAFVPLWLLTRLFEPERLRRIGLSWLVAVMLAGAFHAWSETRVGLTDGRGHPLGEDFINFWAGASLAAAGHAREVYDFVAFHAYQVLQVGREIDLYHYSYPPTALLLSWPLSLQSYCAAWLSWSALGLACFVAAMRIVWPSRGAILYAVAVPAVFTNVMEGQNGLWTAAVFGTGLVWLPRWPALAGALMGVFVCKPQLALLVPFALLAERNWRALCGMVASAAALFTLTLPIYGVDLWRIYFDRVTILRHAILENGDTWVYMPSVFIMARHLGWSVSIAYAVQAIVALGMIIWVVLVWGTGGESREPKNATLVLCSMLATPYIQNYDIAMTAFVPCWLLAEHRGDDHRRLHVYLASTFLVLSPDLIPFLAWGTGVALGWLLILPALLLTLRVPRQAPGLGAFAT